MDLSSFLEYTGILLLILLNGFFSGSEIAMLSVRKTRLEALIEQGHSAASRLLALRENPDNFFATIQIGITVVSVLASTLGGASVVGTLTPRLAKVPVSWIANNAEELALAIVVGVISYLSLVLGELIPKSLGLRFSERWAFVAVYPIQLLAAVSKPMVKVLTTSSNLLLKPFHDKTNFIETRLTREELQALVEDSTRSGAIEESHGDILHRAIEFPELRVRDIAIPYTEMFCLDLSDPPERIREALIQRTHARIPVTRGSRDNIIGWISIRDLLLQLLKGEALNLEPLLHEPYFVPSSVRVEHLLKDLQKRHLQLAIVVDEFGGVEGLATVEDIVEELVGEIYSERAGGPPWKRLADHRWLVPGTMTLSDLSNVVDKDLEPSPYYNTVGGLLLGRLERIPNVGESIDWDCLRLLVKERSDRRIKWVEVELLPEEKTTESEER